MGTSLSDFVVTPEYKQRRISMVRRLFAQMVEAVHYIHQMGVAHNDLRLDNFIVTEFAEVCRPFYISNCRLIRAFLGMCGEGDR